MSVAVSRRGARPFSAFERMVAWRYLRSRRKETMISVISIIIESRGSATGTSVSMLHFDVLGPHVCFSLPVIVIDVVRAVEMNTCDDSRVIAGFASVASFDLSPRLKLVKIRITSVVFRAELVLLVGTTTADHSLTLHALL